MPPKVVEDPPAEGADAEKSGGDEGTKEKKFVWKHDINYLLEAPHKVASMETLPSSFVTSGTLRGDYMQVAKAFGAVPHPAFKPQKMKGSKGRTLTSSMIQQAQPVEGQEGQEQEPAVFTIHSVRMDRTSALFLGLILPESQHLKVIRLLDCRLDVRMMRLLRKGLSGNCSVECLQIEWNPFAEDAPIATVRSEATDGEIAEESGKAMAEFLDDECVLECLSLRACALQRVQIVPMAEMLSTTHLTWQLRQLNLWDNRICDGACLNIGSALEEYRGLEYLGLGKNWITDQGAIAICRPLATEILNDAEVVEPIRAKIKEQQERYDADVKAKAKAKPKAAPKAGVRQRREAPIFVDELEERLAADEGPDDARDSWIFRKYSELKTLSLMENQIRSVATLEKLQPFGPRRAELTVLGTPAASTLLLKYPELSLKERKAFCFPSSGQNADVPGGATDGWLLRLM